MSLRPGRDNDQEVDAPGAWLDTSVEKRRRHDGVGPKFVSGKSINEYFPVITSASPLKPGNYGESVTR